MAKLLSIFILNHLYNFSMDNVVLGGTKQINDYNLNVSESDTRRIIKGCYNISPTLKVFTALQKKIVL